jgi:hypothetical protein
MKYATLEIISLHIVILVGFANWYGLLMVQMGSLLLGTSYVSYIPYTSTLLTLFGILVVIKPNKKGLFQLKLSLLKIEYSKGYADGISDIPIVFINFTKAFVQ